MMQVEVGEFGNLVLREVYSGILLKTESEELAICMRDGGGFEFRYMDQWYIAVNGKVTKVGPTSIDDLPSSK